MGGGEEMMGKVGYAMTTRKSRGGKTKEASSSLGVSASHTHAVFVNGADVTTNSSSSPFAT